MEKIKREKVEKIPRWHFMLKSGLVWGSLGVAILLGAFAVSMIIFQVVNVDIDLLPPGFGGPKIFMILKMIPYFWMAIAGLLFMFVYFDFKQTRKGYRYGAAKVVGASVLISIFLGIGFHTVRAPENAEIFFHEIGPYRHLNFDREKFLVEPETGRLGGMILEINGRDKFILEDFEKGIWNVDISMARIPKREIIFVGGKVRMIGESVGPNEFFARDVKPFRRF